ncbi:MAG TPA: phage holin family protein [Candidatus Paceibacterota bacterium]|nr:phage holin family protein [Candidatus Paceibacterota bacterium]
MRTLARLVLSVIVNAVGLYAAGHYITGVTLPSDLKELVIIAGTLTILNLIVKPILTLALGPVIILTLGLGYLAVNVIVLFILDIIFPSLTIATIPALLWTTLILSALNLVAHLATKK